MEAVRKRQSPGSTRSRCAGPLPAALLPVQKDLSEPGPAVAPVPAALPLDLGPVPTATPSRVAVSQPSSSPRPRPSGLHAEHWEESRGRALLRPRRPLPAGRSGNGAQYLGVWDPAGSASRCRLLLRPPRDRK